MQTSYRVQTKQEHAACESPGLPFSTVAAILGVSCRSYNNNTVKLMEQPEFGSVKANNYMC